MLLQMSADGMPDRVAFGTRADPMTMAEASERARRIADYLQGQPGERVGLIDLNSPAIPLTLFGAALAGKPFVPLNYRLTDDRISNLQGEALVSLGDEQGTRVTSAISPSVSRDTRDNVFTPARGNFSSLGMDFAGIGGDSKFVKFTGVGGGFWLIVARRP